MSSKSRVVEKLIDLLVSEAESWDLGGFTAKHTSGVELWHANGMWHFDLYPRSLGLNPIDKFKLWRAFQVCKANQVLRRLSAF